jgi:hypothetical protein
VYFYAFHTENSWICINNVVFWNSKSMLILKYSLSKPAYSRSQFTSLHPVRFRFENQVKMLNIGHDFPCVQESCWDMQADTKSIKPVSRFIACLLFLLFSRLSKLLTRKIFLCPLSLFVLLFLSRLIYIELRRRKIVHLLFETLNLYCLSLRNSIIPVHIFWSLIIIAVHAYFVGTIYNYQTVSTYFFRSICGL